MLILSLGLTQPGGYMQFCNLEEQYQQCSREDHDITPLDFVFEHLLNLESIVNLIEGEHEYAGGDSPHSPFSSKETAAPFFMIPPGAGPFVLNARDRDGLLSDKVTYSLARDISFLSCFCTDILRPPISA